MRPTLILGLSALLLGAAGQSQYRPGGSSVDVGGLFSGLDNGGNYPDYEEQAQYRPGGSSDYEYENSITGGSPVSGSADSFGGNQIDESESGQSSDNQGQYRPGGSSDYEYEDSITGGSPVSGSSNSFGGNQIDQSASGQNSDNQGQYGSQSVNGAFDIAGSTGNVGTGIHGDLENDVDVSNSQGRPASQQNRPNSNKPVGAGSGGFSGNVGDSNQESEGSNNQSVSGSGSGNQNKDDKKEWSLAESIPGAAGDDYPILSEVPDTSFVCDGRASGGYYADPEAECQAFHICANDGRGGLTKYSFICPNGTIFNQEVLVCDWWFNVDCSLAEELYSINDANAAEREANSEPKSTQTETGNNLRTSGNEENKNPDSQLSSRVNVNEAQNNINQLFDAAIDSSDPQTETLDSTLAKESESPSKQHSPASINLKRGPNTKNRLNNKGTESSNSKRKNIQNKGGYKTPAGPGFNGQSHGGGFIESHETSSEGRPSDNFQLIQNGQTSGGGNNDYSDSGSIQPLNTGYGAPGGPIIGSYDGNQRQ